jgi:Protein of unknown function (DUF3326)
MNIIQKQQDLPFEIKRSGNINSLRKLFENSMVTRFAIYDYNSNQINCEFAQIEDSNSIHYKNIFNFNPRKTSNNNNFNAVMIVPTGIGAQIGGDSGDGNVAARLIGNSVDTLFTHPNVVNAADINEMTPNTIYIEGSVLNDFILGNIGLQPVRSNRMLMLYDKNDPEVEAMAINAASSARVTLGCEIDCLKLEDIPEYKSFYNDRGLAVGSVQYFERLVDILEKYKDEYDSFVLHTKIDGEADITIKYFDNQISINPWGGIESIITHSLSNITGVNVAHSPMLFDNNDIFQFQGNKVVDPVKSPEVMSKTELFCIIKGMYKSPKIVDYTSDSGIYTNRDIHVLITPDRCIGLPLLAALEQGIIVIAVEDDRNVMKNDLEKLPWRKGQFYKAKNYFEASGLLTALKNGISPTSFERPISPTKSF